MLQLIVPGAEFYDEATESFITIGDVTLELEHSLVSLSKWESEYQKPFLGPGEKTTEDVIGYVKAMILTPNVPENLFSNFSPENFTQINSYIDSPQSATTFGFTEKGSGRGEVVTSELIYYWLITFNIPFECQYWHLNRLFALIRICNLKNSKEKKMSRSEIASRNREINAQRKAKLGTNG